MIGQPNDMSLFDAVTVARKAIAHLLPIDEKHIGDDDLQNAYWVLAHHHPQLNKEPTAPKPVDEVK